MVHVIWWSPGWCPHHTSGAVNVFLRVPSPAPGIMPKAQAHTDGPSPYGLGGVIMLVVVA